VTTRRQFIKTAALLGIGSLSGRTLGAFAAERTIALPLANGSRPLSTDFPQKAAMIVLRSRPPLLETPFEIFDKGVFTPNEYFFVRWHLADIPTAVDTHSFRLAVHGHVAKPLSLTLNDILHGFEPFEIVAVNQCSGNSRGFFEPRVAGGEWGNGAMGNARWTGVRLKDVLARAGVQAGAVQVRFNGLDRGVVAQTPDFMKSLNPDHALDGEVMIAYAMNGKPLPLLNGFPLRLVAPGWYSTYWVKMLNDIEVLDKPDDNFWMKTAYKIPDTPHANMTPGAKDVKMIPINRLVPRSFITNLGDGAVLHSGRANPVRGIAFGGDAGVAKVMLSADGGKNWRETKLGEDFGKYSFRQWQTVVTPTQPGPQVLMVKAINTQGVAQISDVNWNPGGYMRNVIESVTVRAV